MGKKVNSEWLNLVSLQDGSNLEKLQFLWLAFGFHFNDDVNVWIDYVRE